MTFGTHHRLVNAPNTSTVARLTQSCRSRDEFASRLSDFADMLKQFNIAEDIVTAEERERRDIKKDQTIALIRAALQTKLDQADLDEAEAGLKALQQMVTVRMGFQHQRGARALPKSLAQLGVPFPVRDWNAAWTIVQARAVEAINTIRRAMLRNIP